MRIPCRDRFFPLIPSVSLVLLTGCSTVLYQANGEYLEEGSHRRILLQWKAQEYHIPFVDTRVDYGSISLQAECMADLLLDHQDHPELGLVFLELPQDFRLVADAPEHRVGHYLVCAMLDDGQSIDEAMGAESIQLLVLCESATGNTFLPASLIGYSLGVSSRGLEETLQCEF